MASSHFRLFNRLCLPPIFVREVFFVSLCFCVGCSDETNLSNPTVTGVTQKLDVSSSAIPSGGECPTEFTINGAGISPPVAWTGAPPETKAFALSLWRLSRKGQGEPPITLSYWVLYNIPAEVKGLQKDSKDIGVMGISDRGKIYLPLQSKEPIVEHYYLTVFALSKELEFDNEKVDRRDLVKAIRDITLAEGTLKFHFKQDGNHK